MKCISIKQPFAYLLCANIKDIENRTWKLPEKYKGERVLIHASAKLAKHEFTWEQSSVLAQYDEKFDMHFSAIIGSVRFVDCVINHPSIWAEKTSFSRSVILNNDLTVKGYRVEEEKSIYNWVATDAVLFEIPILNVKGKLGFWNYDLPEECETILNKAL